MDLRAFECPICLSLFEGSIFQCKNGHVVCDACRVYIHGTCPTCCSPVGEIRCRALENAIADMVLPCAFSSHGCTQLLKLEERRDHEALCHYGPFVCPFQGCAYFAASALRLHDHIRDDAHASNKVVSGSAQVVLHRSMPFEVLLDRVGSAQVVLHWSMPFEVLLDHVDRRVFLLLNGGDVRSGRSLSVVCLGPRPAANQLLEYKPEVGGAGEPGALSLSASGSVPCMRSWAGQHPTDGFLFVPDAYWASFLCVLVNVRVQKSVRVQKLAVDSLVRCFKHASLEAFVSLMLALFAVGLLLVWKTNYI